MRRQIFAVALVLILSGCNADLPSATGGVKIKKFDAKERSIITAPRTRPKNSRVRGNGPNKQKDNNSEDKERERAFFVCAEPSPDALSSISTALAGSLNYSGLRNLSEAQIKIANTFKETAKQLGNRNATIQLLRDGLYRQCEAYMNGFINKTTYEQVANKYINAMVVLLAVEELTSSRKATLEIPIESGIVEGSNNSLQTQISVTYEQGKDETEMRRQGIEVQKPDPPDRKPDGTAEPEKEHDSGKLSGKSSESAGDSSPKGEDDRDLPSHVSKMTNAFLRKDTLDFCLYRLPNLVTGAYQGRSGKDNEGKTSGQDPDIGIDKTTIMEGFVRMCKLIVATESRKALSDEIGKDSDFERLFSLMLEGNFVDVKNEYGKTPLHLAVEDNDPEEEVIEFLIKKGADINAKDVKGLTPLHSAIWSGNVEIARLLIEEEADVTAEDKNGYTPVYYAVWKDQCEIVELLIKKRVDINLRDKHGATPLHYAVWSGNVEIAELLIEKGADVDAEDRNKSRPIHYASTKGHTEAVGLLISEGADINAKHVQGWTPLYEAVAKGGSLELVELLLANKEADVDARDNKGWAPLHKAVENGRAYMVEKLLCKGADVNARDNKGRTPLHEAVKNGRVDIVEKLLDAGADVNARDNKRLRPLHEVVKNGRVDMVEKLLDAGADVNARDNKGRTPVYWARRKGYTVIEEILRRESHKSILCARTESTLKCSPAKD